jgi:hypothetical protein
MTRRLATILAVLALLAAQLGMPAASLAAPPVASGDDGVVIQKNASATPIDVLANDTFDPEATITAVSDPAHGTAAIAGDGLSVSYAPDPDYTGLDTFTYTVTDPDVIDGADTAVVSVRVNPPPVAFDNPSQSCWYQASHTFTLPEDSGEFEAGHLCDLLSNDTDDGSVVDWVVVDGPDHGTLSHHVPPVVPGLTGDFGYTPDPNFFTLPGGFPGPSWISDSFTYRATDNDGAMSAPATVTFWVAPVNDAPTFTAGPSVVSSLRGVAYSAAWALNPDPGPGEGYQTVHFNLEGSPSNDPSLFSVAPAISPAGVLSYTPAPGKLGSASFSVTLQDDGGLEDYGANSGAPPAADTSDPVTLTITISNVAPVAVDDPAVPGCNPAATPPAFGGSFPIPEDWGQFVLSASCGPSANDSDPDGTIASWQIDTPPAHGSLEWDSDFPGVVGYTPDPDWSTLPGDLPGGNWLSDSFTYHVIDDDGTSSNIATYRLWIAPVNDAPTFTPGSAVVHGFRGTTYDQPWATSISPGPNEATQTVHFEVTNTDLHGNPDLFAADPTIGADGRLTFTLAAGQVGSATVTVVAKDDGGLENYGVTVHPKDTSDPATFDIVADNSPPVAGDDGLTVAEDQATTSAVSAPLGNDTDVDPDTLTITARTNGAKGIVTMVGSTGLSYKPNPNQYGSDTFTYTISDGHGGTSIGTVHVTITPVNDPPNAINDGATTPIRVWLKAGPQAIAVLANDTWLPDAPETLRITKVTQGGHGTVAITGSGTGLTYTPIGTTTTTDFFKYTITDGHGGTDTASVYVKPAYDTTLPKATITGLTKSTITGSTRLRLTLTWTLTDTGSGLRSQLLQRRTDSGSWITVTLPSLSTRTASFAMYRGHTYTFRVRGTDRSGNVGWFAYKSIRI